MSSRVRRGRTPRDPDGSVPAGVVDGSRRAVVVTGAGGSLPTTFAEAWVAVAGSDLDLRRVLSAGAEVSPQDLVGVDAVVHLAYDPLDTLRPAAERPDVVGVTRRLLDAAEAAQVGQVVVVTSAVVYGADPQGSIPRSECDPPAGVADGGVLDGLLEVEAMVSEWRATPNAPPVTVLRPAVLVGPGIDGVVLRHFAAPRLLTVRGVEMGWQFCHLEDLASACSLALAQPLDDAVVTGAGWLDTADVTRLARKRRLELPASVVFGAAERLHQVGVALTPAASVRHLVYPWVVDAQVLAKAGWQARYDQAECLQLLLDAGHHHVAVAGRMVHRRDAVGAVGGAAGATVAAIGTAVLVRRSRRRTGGPR